MKEKRLAVSIGICAYNEEKNIGELLRSIKEQITEKIDIAEVVIVSDACIDKTNEIVQHCGDERVRLIARKERCGKYAAVNTLLKEVVSSILVLASADIVLDPNAIEQLCLPFLDNQTCGITGGHPIVTDCRNTFFGYLSSLQWRLHHRIALSKPKFGELIAFRAALVNELPPTLVDEEHIASIVRSQKHSLHYMPKATLYNKGPETIREFLVRRRALFVGHMLLKYKSGYEASTLSVMRIVKALVFEIRQETFKHIVWTLGVVFLEMLGRFLGFYDMVFKKYNVIWETTESTKRVINNNS